MSNCFIFTTGPSGGHPIGAINLAGSALESSRNEPINWTCVVNYADSLNAMQLKVKECVKEHFLTEYGVTVGGVGDKIIFVGGFSS